VVVQHHLAPALLAAGHPFDQDDAALDAAVGGFFLLWGWLGLSTRAQLLVLVPIVLVFPLWFFRYSRALWLALEWSLNHEP